MLKKYSEFILENQIDNYINDLFLNNEINEGLISMLRDKFSGLLTKSKDEMANLSKKFSGEELAKRKEQLKTKMDFIKQKSIEVSQKAKTRITNNIEKLKVKQQAALAKAKEELI